MLQQWEVLLLILCHAYHYLQSIECYFGGNIPDTLGIREATEFFEIMLFSGKFMRFGYEKSFILSNDRRGRQDSG